MRFKFALLCYILGLTGAVRAADLDLRVQTALQAERGGNLLHEDQIAHTALHVTPALTWRWNRNKWTSDVRFSSAVAMPAYTGSTVNALSGEWRTRYAIRKRTVLETRLRFGQIAFDQATRWQSRSRIGGDLGFSTSLTPSCYLLGGYTFATLHYDARPTQTGQTTSSPQIGTTSQPSAFDQTPQTTSALLGGDPPPVDQTGSPAGERRDHRNRLHGTLMWVGKNYWLTSGVSFEHNGASLPAYGYHSTQINLGGGVQYHAMDFSLQNSRDWRGYRLPDDTTSSWRSWWISFEADWRAKPWMQVFANIQKEYGNQDGQQTITPWTLTSIGLKFKLPLKQKTATPHPQNPLMPHRTKAGWVFRYHNTRAKNVHLIGTFSSWNPQKYALKRVPHHAGLWEIIVKLDPGVYEYAFIVDGADWVAPPQAPLYVDDGFGNRNGVLVVENKTELTASE